jgi:hypothetical protein
MRGPFAICYDSSAHRTACAVTRTACHSKRREYCPPRSRAWISHPGWGAISTDAANAANLDSGDLRQDVAAHARALDECGTL